MPQTIHYIDELVSDPNIHNGQPISKNSQVRVIDVVRAYVPEDNESAGTIAARLGVHIGQIYAALTWYHMHKSDFDDQIQREDAAAESE
ncbi:MAG: hypothetical protein IT319_17480 [Anaerolineae bacterium]|nr:hypothetical protein [Anaerolineae bacterium]